MSESKVKQDIADRIITFDFAGPKFHLTAMDQKQLGKRVQDKLDAQGRPILLENGLPDREVIDAPERVVPRITRAIIGRLRDAVWPPAQVDQRGQISKPSTDMERKDAKHWRVWKPYVIDDDAEFQLEMRVATFDWLLAIANDDKVKVYHDVADYREDLIEYMEETRAKLFVPVPEN